MRAPSKAQTWARAHPLRVAFLHQRKKAAYRGIRFLLTFEDWLEIWRNSGHLAERGRRRGQYVMCRPGDKGPYAVGNVRVAQVEDNVREAHEGSQHSAASIAKMSRVQMGHPVSAATRDKLRYPRTEKYKEGLRAIAKLRPPPTKKTRARMSEKHTRNWQEFGAAYYGR